MKQEFGDAVTEVEELQKDAVTKASKENKEIEKQQLVAKNRCEQQKIDKEKALREKWKDPSNESVAKMQTLPTYLKHLVVP